MQAIAPVTEADLLSKQQRPPLLKFEILYCCCWVDLTSYVIEGSLSVSTAGAELSPAPVAGQWSVALNNKGGRFDPDEPGYAPYNEYFKVGRKVKISIGARYGGVKRYWRRIYGFMEIPNFSIHKSEVSLSGFDNMQFLTDTKLKEPENHFGSLMTFDSVSSEGSLGAEMYDEKDAMDIDDEADNVANWVVSNCTFVHQGDVGGGSTLVGKMIVTGEDPDPIAKNIDVTAATVPAVAGKEYLVTFKYQRKLGDGPVNFEIWQTVSGDLRQCGRLEGLDSAAYVEVSLYFTALASGAIQIWLRAGTLNDEFRFDQFSIKEHTAPVWYRYELPSASKGVHYATLDGEPVWPGKQKGEGWYYDADTRYFYFDEDKRIEDGTDNLVVHYYTQQAPENVVADLLARAGLYSNQAEALAAMIYDATSILVDKVWFKAGSTCLNAVRMLCERVNYRFFFNYGARPVFKPAPTVSNLLIDGGLNLWTSATSLTYWTKYISGTSTVNREATEKIEGDFSCRLDVDAGNNSVYIQQTNIPLTPLRRYKLIIWYMNSVAGKTARFAFLDTSFIIYLKEDGTWNVGSYPIVLPNSTIWKKFEVEFYAHADYSNYILYLMSASAASSSIYFDKASICKEDFTFTESYITNIRDYEDRSEIRNMITIEGIEQALPEGAEETKPSKFKGEASEVASINKYGEHTWPIKNHLFQDQASVDAYCAIYLAAFKDPKWYTTYDTPFNPMPLEKGDIGTWRKKYEAGSTPINQKGIIRDIAINEFTVSYTIEKIS